MRPVVDQWIVLISHPVNEWSIVNRGQLENGLMLVPPEKVSVLARTRTITTQVVVRHFLLLFCNENTKSKKDRVIRGYVEGEMAHFKWVRRYFDIYWLF